jgi:hypothetical protein
MEGVAWSSVERRTATFAVVILGAAPACSDGETSPAPAPVEGCIDIQVDGRLLEAEGGWGRDQAYVARRPFWRDDQGLHIVWLLREENGLRRLLVSSFDPKNGKALEHRAFRDLEEDLLIFDAAGAPDGTFAAIVGYANDTGYYERILFGTTRGEPRFEIVDPPWPAEEGDLVDVGWDGEAFALHGFWAAEPGYLLTRMRLDESGPVTVLAPKRVGTIGSIYEEFFHVVTDADSGITRAVNSRDDGVWLTGHHRDGTALAGTEADGGVPITTSGIESRGQSYWLGIGQRGDDAMLAWLATRDYEASFQHVQHATAKGSGFALEDRAAAKTLAWWRDAWWMAADENHRIAAYRLGNTHVLGRAALVTYSPCNGGCDFDVGLHVSRLMNVVWDDELWFGYWDFSNDFNVSDSHPERSNPYRIVLVKDGCVYPSVYDVYAAR